jgi:hypothetical protein
MQDRSKNQFVSKIPAILAQFLEVSDDRVLIREYIGDPRPDLVLKIGEHTFVAEVKSSSARTSLLSAFTQLDANASKFGPKAIPLVVVPYMGALGRRFCDEHGLAWLDLSGNAHIKAPGLLINVQGQPNRFKRPGRPSNLFAPQSSRIARHLLIEPHRSFTQRELSKATGLDEGYTSRIVRRLERDGLVVRDDQSSLRANDPDQLLDAWHEVYDFSGHLIIKGYIAARSGDELLWRVAETLAQNEIGYAATGLGAAWLYTHFAKFRIASFYFRHSPDEGVFRALHFREGGRGANTWLVVPKDEGVFHGSVAREGILCVHPIQIYLDLKGHPERSSEAASKFREEHLKWSHDA